MISYPWDSKITGYDEEGHAILDRASNSDILSKHYERMYSDGIWPNPSDGFQVVTCTEEMTVIVKPGSGVLKGKLFIENDNRTLIVQASESSDRIDRVVLRRNRNIEFRNVDLYVLKGVAATNPVAPSLTRNDNVWELGIADLFIARNSTVVSQSRITDTRLNNELCGITVNLPKAVDTQSLYAQYQASLDEYMKFVASALDETLAGNLQSQINATKVDVTKAQADIMANFDYLNKLHSNGEVLDDALRIDVNTPTDRLNTKCWCLYNDGVSGTVRMPPGCVLGFRSYEYFNSGWHVLKVSEVYPVQGRIWTRRYDKPSGTWYDWVDNTQVSINGIKCQKISEVAIPSVGTQVSLASIGDASNILCTIGATAYDKYVSSVIIDASIAQEFILSTFWNTTAFISCLIAWNPSTKIMTFNSIERGTNWNTANLYIRFYKIL
ncbi:hypothetical protein ACTQ6A_14285 [Lachnospiraceae bacterium LCP25S3_G4]